MPHLVAEKIKNYNKMHYYHIFVYIADANEIYISSEMKENVKFALLLPADGIYSGRNCFV